MNTTCAFVVINSMEMKQNLGYSNQNSDVIYHQGSCDDMNIYVTQSGKNGLIAYLQVLRNVGFKYSVCCSSPMVEATCSNFHTFYTNFLPSRASTTEVANT